MTFAWFGKMMYHKNMFVSAKIIGKSRRLDEFLHRQGFGDFVFHVFGFILYKQQDFPDFRSSGWDFEGLEDFPGFDTIEICPESLRQESPLFSWGLSVCDRPLRAPAGSWATHYATTVLTQHIPGKRSYTLPSFPVARPWRRSCTHKLLRAQTFAPHPLPSNHTREKPVVQTPHCVWQYVLVVCAKIRKRVLLGSYST